MSQLFESVEPLAFALDYHTTRHNLITSNIANVDTPGYRPREVTFENELERLGGTMHLQETEEGHFSRPDAPGPGAMQVYEETWASPGADGNFVRLEHEMARLQANSVRYRASTQMVAHHLGMLRYAITNRR